MFFDRGSAILFEDRWFAGLAAIPVRIGVRESGRTPRSSLPD